ncbi:MAG: divalent-cation tolerance protein CutA [Planctomycetaceae bacterium]|jgi:periplasmic divalent cation tolerance protein|nr:divalent-cation tolerance protein CutA [Planctomycetaceae bacterium]
MTDFIQIQTTYPDEASALAAARLLVEQHIVACAQVTSKIRSIYIWEDKQEEETEYLCLMKTKQENFDHAAKTIRQTHPYKCPQIIAIPITEVTTDYAEWMSQLLD